MSHNRLLRVLKYYRPTVRRNQRFTLFPAYIYQKDERALRGNLQSSNYFNNNNNNNNNKQIANADSKQFDETVDHIISACPILPKEQYIKRHDTVFAQLHFNTCKKIGVKLDKE